MGLAAELSVCQEGIACDLMQEPAALCSGCPDTRARASKNVRSLVKPANCHY